MVIIRVKRIWKNHNNPSLNDPDKPTLAGWQLPHQSKLFMWIRGVRNILTDCDFVRVCSRVHPNRTRNFERNLRTRVKLSGFKPNNGKRGTGISIADMRNFTHNSGTIASSWYKNFSSIRNAVLEQIEIEIVSHPSPCIPFVTPTTPQPVYPPNRSRQVE